MSATVDANILVYASNSSDPVYPQATQLLTRLAAGPDLLYLFWPVVLGLPADRYAPRNPPEAT